MIDFLLDLSVWIFQTPNILASSIIRFDGVLLTRTYSGHAKIMSHGKEGLIIRFPGVQRVVGLELWYFSNVSNAPSTVTCSI